MQRENISDIIEAYLKTILAQEAAVEIRRARLRVVLIAFLRKSIMSLRPGSHRLAATLLRVNVVAGATFAS